jgi:hypothetical protein
MIPNLAGKALCNYACASKQLGSLCKRSSDKEIKEKKMTDVRRIVDKKPIGIGMEITEEEKNSE